MKANYSTAPQVEILGISHSRLPLANVFSLYRNQFANWFAVTAPTSLLADAVLWMADQRIRAITGSIPLLELKNHKGAIAASLALRFNRRFARPASDTASDFRRLPRRFVLARCLSLHYQRVVAAITP